jgi:hypothetical protein
MSDEIWKPLPAPLSKYEVSDHGGRVRHIRRGNVLTGRPGNKGYYLIKLYDDEGKQQTRTVHSLVLLAHRGARPAGQEACHGDDDPAHNDLSNLRWDTKPANRSDRRENAPPKRCVRCGEPFKGNGKRCHPCVVAIGEEAAAMLQSGTPLADAAAALDYPSAEGVHALAVKYGGYGQRRSIAATLRGLLRRRGPSDSA